MIKMEEFVEEMELIVDLMELRSDLSKLGIETSGSVAYEAEGFLTEDLAEKCNYDNMPNLVNEVFNNNISIEEAYDVAAGLKDYKFEIDD